MLIQTSLSFSSISLVRSLDSSNNCCCRISDSFWILSIRSLASNSNLSVSSLACLVKALALAWAKPMISLVRSLVSWSKSFLTSSILSMLDVSFSSSSLIIGALDRASIALSIMSCSTGSLFCKSSKASLISLAVWVL